MNSRRTQTLLLAIACLIQGCSRDLDEWVRSSRPAEVAAAEMSLLDTLEERAKETLESLSHPGSKEEAEACRSELRALLSRSLGLDLLPWPPQLRPQRLCTLIGDGYVLEKIAYQTFPETLVPGHLYLPEHLEKPVPGIVFYPGHWREDSKARTDFQTFCINMARLGFVVLNFDPFGQGERGVSRRDHCRTESLLLGVSQQGFAEYETRCAIEYLLSRKEVDPTRIGMTGASGGGYNTWMTAALDDRIKVAVPVVGTSDFYEQIHVCRPLDWYHATDHCHFPAKLIRYANNHELLSMVAPRPLMIIAASEDQSFPVNGVRAVYKYGENLYQSYESDEKISYYEDSFSGHGYQQRKREAAYGWFLRWLANRGDGSPFPEPATETFPHDSDEMRCFPKGSKQPAGPGMVKLVQELTQEATPLWRSDSLEEVFGSLPVPKDVTLTVGEEEVQRLEIPTEGSLRIPSFLIKPERPEGLVVAIHDQGKEEATKDPLVQQFLGRNWALCGIDPRGFGELKTEKEGWVFAVSLLLGENFVWRQAWDIHRTVDVLVDLEIFRRLPVVLYGSGHGASLSVTFLLAQYSQAERVPLKAFVLREPFVSFRHFIDRPVSLERSFLLTTDGQDVAAVRDRQIPIWYFAFDALHHFDLPQFMSCLSDVRGFVVNPIDGDWDPLSQDAAERILPGSIEVRTAIGPAEPGFRIEQILD